MRQTKQIRHIQEMEAKLDEANEILGRVSAALADFERAQLLLSDLDAYYTGEDWLKDFEDDEKGKFPPELKRGVLSEDAVYDLLTEDRQLAAEMLRIVADMI